MNAATSGRIPIEFRIGVTGHRTLIDSEAVAADVTAAVQRILDLRSTLGSDVTPVGVTVVSALAEGADRVVVQEVSRLLPARLEAILPMPAEQYCTDFETEASRQAFNTLLEKASQTIVVGDARRRNESYERAGRAVVDRSDVLIAVWDGKPARGRGGTARIVAYARESNTPLLWIRPDRMHRITEEWGDNIDTSDPPRLGPLSPRAFAQLDRFNRRSVPLSRFAAAPAIMPSSLTPAASARLSRFVEYAAPSFTRSDQIAQRFQRQSQLAAVSLYVLAAGATIIVSAQVLFRGDPGIVWGEVAALCLILGVLLVGRARRWHDNWISTRYLAERIRSSVFLAAAGVGEGLERIGGSGLIPDPTDEWLARAFEEIWLRRPPQPQLTDADVEPLQRLLADAWIGEQTRYHDQARSKNERRHRLLSAGAIVFFLMSLIAALLHTTGALEHTGASDSVAFLSVIIPAVAAALSGYAAHREFGQHANRSRHMVARLTEARRRMEAADSLKAVQQIAISTEQLMRGENSDWYALIHLHELEVPV